MKLKVTLKSVGNPDFRQDPTRPMYGCERNQTVEVKSFAEASLVCREFIDRNDLGSGNWAGGDVFDDSGKLIARVSYNGKLWEPDTKNYYEKQLNP